MRGSCAPGHWPELSILPPAREADARSTCHVSAARCVRPRPQPRRAPAGLVARVRPDFRTPSRPAGPSPRSEALLRTKGGRRASLPPSPSAVPAPARPAGRALPTPRRVERPAAAPRVTAPSESPKFGLPPRVGTSPSLISFLSAPRPHAAACQPPSYLEGPVSTRGSVPGPVTARGGEDTWKPRGLSPTRGWRWGKGGRRCAHSLAHAQMQRLLAIPGSSEDRSSDLRDYISHKPAGP